MTRAYEEDVRRCIKQAEKHFSKHVALLESVGRDIEVLDFRRPDTVEYALRVVFDDERGGRVYISGDIGEAVVYPTCKAKLEDMALCFTMRDKNGDLDVREGYFLEKVKATSDRYVWDEESFNADFREHCREYGIDECVAEDFLTDNMGTFGGIEICGDSGIRIDGYVTDEIRKIDEDYWEWFFDCGKRIDPRIVLWLVGMRLAWEQIEEVKKAPKE